MFEKTLTDVVKGIRGTKRDTGLYISQCIAEIKQELKSPDIFTKANALQKLTFLQMMGYGMSWASFACVEVMSSQRFAHKRIGYLAGCQGFTEADTDIILLTTNLLKKELKCASSVGGNGVYEAGLAINFVANVVTEDLARELLPEVTHLTQHPHPYLRKKAVLCLFKLFVKYPQGLRLTFDRIQQCLSDPEAPVASCAVNVITELSDKNPKNYLLMAPQFFQLLTSSSNNWMLIKVVKLLGSLVSEEPRLARKLLEPLAGIVKNTAAKSLLYEAVYTITLALPYCRKADGSMPSIVPSIVQLCSQTLKEFVEDTDQNLKYLGLVGFGSLMQSHPQVLSQTKEHKDLILMCLSDEDVTIRTRALELLSGMATRKNMRDLITQLLRHVELADGAYQRELVEQIVNICRQEKYALISDFSWYLTQVLVKLAHIRAVEDAHGELLKQQIMDVALRVLPVRKVAVKSMTRLLLEQMKQQMQSQGISSSSWAKHQQRSEGVMSAVLPAAAWVVGEYSHLVTDLLQHEDEDEVASEGDVTMLQTTKLISASGPYHAIIKALTWPVWTVELDASTQSIYVTSAMKVFASACASGTEPCSASDSELESCVSTLRKSLPLFIESTDSEVQERALSALNLLKSLGLTKCLTTKSDTQLKNGADGMFSMPDATFITEPKSSEETTDTDESDDNEHNLLVGVTAPGTTSSTNNDFLGLSMGGGSTDLLAPPKDIAQMDGTKKLKSSSTAMEQSTNASDDPFDMDFLKGPDKKMNGLDAVVQNSSNVTSSSTTAGLCRQMSDILVSMLIPDPMKPVSGKAQRRVAPPIDVSMDESLRGNFFSDLLTQDNKPAMMRKKQYNARAATSKRLDAVSFTQQKPTFGVGADEQQKNPFGGGPIVAIASQSASNPLDIFENGSGTAVTAPTSTAQRPNDPFYLQSTSASTSLSAGANAPTGMAKSQVATAASLSSKFGVIQLGDDDDGEDHHESTNGRHTSRKEKKKKKKKNDKKASMNDADLTMFDLMGQSRTGGQTDGIVPNQQFAAPTAIYRSDDEDDAEEHNRRKPSSRPAANQDEFAGLAQVDLTTPLGADEVMPVRTHRQTPAPAAEIAPSSTATLTMPESGMTPSRSKKEKKKKGRKEKKVAASGTAATSNGGGAGADLLDLGMFDTIPSVAPSPNVLQRPTIPAQGMGGVSDDLLSMGMSNTGAPKAPFVQDPSADLLSLSPLKASTVSSASAQGTIGWEKATQDVETRTSSHKRPWLKGTIKADSSKGSEGNFGVMALHYKVYPTKSSKSSRASGGNEGTPSASILLRLTNNGRISMRNVALGFLGDTSQVLFEDIPPGASVESESKIGPFSYSDASGQSSEELKGHATAAGCSRVTIKVALPCAMLLKPIQSPMTLDGVMSELAQGDWSSHSCKLDITSLSSPNDAIQIVSSFMKASIIASNDPSSAVLACHSASSNTQIRALVKVKTSSIKVDVKCSNGNAAFSKALVSDLKKLLL